MKILLQILITYRKEKNKKRMMMENNISLGESNIGN